MTSRLAALAPDAVDPGPVAGFWCAVLGWSRVDEDAEVISIGPAAGAEPTLDVLRVPEGTTVKDRLHLDLRADGTRAADELVRLRALGARRTDVGQGPDVSWVVLADPEGDELHLLSRTAQDVEREASGG